MVFGYVKYAVFLVALLLLLSSSQFSSMLVRIAAQIGAINNGLAGTIPLEGQVMLSILIVIFGAVIYSIFK